MLRSEHVQHLDETVLRFTISGYNISNAIGFVCNYDYDLAVTHRLIQNALDYHISVPFCVGWDIYLTDRGRDLGESYAPMAQVHEAHE
jgi:hypothetical protein